MAVSPSYKINPKFRLSTPHLSVAWHCVDVYTLGCEAVMEVPGRHVFFYKKVPQVLVQCHGDKANAQIDLIYHPATDFEVRGIQKWLRELFRDIIYSIASDVLPRRVKYWEEAKALHGRGVEVKRLKKNVLACCTGDNVIMLQPFLALFKQEWADEVILHEMAHYHHKHHRKAFWDFLSTLLGHDARKAKAKKDIELSPYYGYCLYLTQK